MTEAELKKHLDTAAKSPQQIATAVSGLPDEILRYKPAPGKWCILEVLGHLADIEIVYAHRFRQMLADKDPLSRPSIRMRGRAVWIIWKHRLLSWLRFMA